MLFRELKWGYVIVSDRVDIWYSEVRERLSEELTFKLRSECHKVTSHVNILGKGIPGTEKS